MNHDDHAKEQDRHAVIMARPWYDHGKIMVWSWQDHGMAAIYFQPGLRVILVFIPPLLKSLFLAKQMMLNVLQEILSYKKVLKNFSLFFMYDEQ